MKIVLSNAYIFIAKKQTTTNKPHLVEFKMAFTFSPSSFKTQNLLEDVDKGQKTSFAELAVALLHLNALIWSTTTSIPWDGRTSFVSVFRSARDRIRALIHAKFQLYH